jgi:hypothetical protein
MIYKVTTKTHSYYIVADNNEEAIREANLRTAKSDIVEIKRELEGGERYLLGCSFLLGVIFFFLIYVYYINFL